MAQIFVDWYQSHPEINIFGLIIGIILSIFGILISYKGIKRKQISYSIDKINLIGDSTKNIDGLEIKYKNKTVNNLVVTNVIIWNSGNATITNHDVISSEPLRIKFDENIFIYDYGVIQSNEPANHFQINKVSNSLIIEFEYIEPYQGCVIQIFNNSNSFADIDLLGKFIGIKKFKYTTNDFRGGLYIHKKKLFIFLMLAALIINILGIWVDIRTNNFSLFFYINFIFCIYFIYTLFVILNGKIPKELDSFHIKHKNKSKKQV